MAAKPIRKTGTKASNTGDSSKRKGQFVKNDPRINRLGRPRSFDALRELAQQIANETAAGADGKPLVISGHVATIAEMILRSWARSSNPQLVRGFIEVAYGKVPDELRLDLSRLDDSELVKYVEPILARLGISLEPPEPQGIRITTEQIQVQLDATPDPVSAAR